MAIPPQGKTDIKLTSIRTKTLQEDLLDDVCVIHQSAYEARPNFTYYLGGEFVKASYSFFCRGERFFGVVSYVDGRAVGFCVGGSSIPFDPLNRFRRRNALSALACRPHLWFHRDVGQRLVKGIFKTRDVEDSPDLGSANYGFIYSIAVVPAMSGRGIGKNLLKEYEEVCGARGLARVIIPIGVDNEPSLRMARGGGYELIEDARYGDNAILVKVLSTPSALLTVH